MLLLLFYSRSEMSALGGIIQLKSIAIGERPVWRLHWSASPARDCVWQLTRFGCRKWRSGLNRISHPDWVKLSVELNCAPNQNTKFFASLQEEGKYFKMKMFTKRFINFEKIFYSSYVRFQLVALFREHAFSFCRKHCFHELVVFFFLFRDRFLIGVVFFFLLFFLFPLASCQSMFHVLLCGCLFYFPN